MGRIKPMVMSVDDDKTIQKLIERFLVANNCDVVCAAGGGEALIAVEQAKPDLVLLDVMMPGIDGYEVCTQLQKNPETAYVPVIFLSALGEEKDQARALAAGGVDYLIKPFQKAQLISKVNHYLKTRTQWKDMLSSPETVSATSSGKFKQFKEYLLCQLALSPMDRERVSALTSSQIYSICPTLGIRPAQMAKHVADFSKVPYVSHLNSKDVALGILPTAFCRTNHVVPVNDVTANVGFVLSDPFDFQVQDTIRRYAEQGQTYRILVTEPDNIDLLFNPKQELKPAPEGKADASQSTVVVAVDAGGIIRVSKDTKLEEESANLDVLAASADDAPVVRLANELLATAIRTGASDIHIEPRENSLGIRYRVDGMLHERESVPKSLQPPLISRFKIMANMDIAERRIPQDGSVRIFYEDRDIDLRISSLPSRHGEKIVIRVLDKGHLSLDFDALGFEPHNLKLFRESIQKPHGMILVTGPTGSGKTTTLYTALQALNDPSTNIVTVEDPIEYELHRITQVQIHPDAGLTFPVALRSILRQDPDVIMVGEIRDPETLDIGVKAALTGHLVLSTLHTNDAPTTVARLVDMGSDAFLVAASLEMIAAQRLIRKLCSNCKKRFDPPEKTLQKLKFKSPPDAKFFQAAGCERCSAGYKGRMAIIEIMPMDDDLRQSISRGAKVDEIRKYATDSGGLVPLQHDALIKASRGATSLEEVLGLTI